MDDEEMLGYVHRTIETASRVRKLISRERESGVHVSIHVSTDVYDWLRQRAQQVGAEFDTPVFFGFPVVLHDDWTETRIEVHTRRVVV